MEEETPHARADVPLLRGTDRFQNTFWELETEQATAEQTGAGTWQVALDVRARKEVVDEAGVETAVPMKDWVEVGVFASPRRVRRWASTLYVRKHRIRSGKQTITVPRKPARAGIDPYHLLIDWEMEDSVAAVKVKS